MRELSGGRKQRPQVLCPKTKYTSKENLSGMMQDSRRLREHCHKGQRQRRNPFDAKPGQHHNPCRFSWLALEAGLQVCRYRPRPAWHAHITQQRSRREREIIQDIGLVLAEGKERNERERRGRNPASDGLHHGVLHVLPVLPLALAGPVRPLWPFHLRKFNFVSIRIFDGSVHAGSVIDPYDVSTDNGICMLHGFYYNIECT